MNAVLTGDIGNRTVFVQLKQGQLSWWQPLALNIKEPVEIIGNKKQGKNSLECILHNNTDHSISGSVEVNKGVTDFIIPLTIAAFASQKIIVPEEKTIVGSNEVSFTWKESTRVHITKQNIVNWNIDKRPVSNMQSIVIDQYFNDKVTNIFKNQYLSPRPATVTLQLPTQGIGEWTHPMLTAIIDDSGLRRKSTNANAFTIQDGVSFRTVFDTTKPNIIFTSQWDNYPREASIPLSGKAFHAYLLMAGSTDPMQSRMINGAVIITYTDGTGDTLFLKNPETWWPIEQDYYEDGYAFTTNTARPIRIHLKTGKIVSPLNDATNIYNGKMIDGGAATVLDMVLNGNKTLRELKLQAWSNDVVIGLMSVNLTR